MNAASENNWFKLFALMCVGGVAKALFGPPRVEYRTIREAPEQKDAETHLEHPRLD